MSGFNALQSAAYDAAARQRHRSQFMGMSAYDRHKKMVADLATYYGRRLGGQEGGEGQEGQPPIKTDYEVLREAYRFIRSEADDAADSWEVRLAKRYYAKLFREFAIADLSRHREGRLGLRWRTQREVVGGKGQFTCGAVGCEERRGLASFEVPFTYEEAGERKQALVKVRVCPTHAYQLNFKKHKEAEEAHKRRERKEAKRTKRRKRRRRSRGSRSSDGSDSSVSESEEEEGSSKSGRHKRSSRRGSIGRGSERRGGEEPSGLAADVGEAGGSGRGAGPAGVAALPASGQGAVGAGERQPGQAGSKDEFEEFFQGLFE